MSAKPQYKVPIGSTLDLDGVRWNVTGKDQGKIFVESLESGEIAQFLTEWLQQKIADFSCRVVTPREEAKREELREYTGGIEHIEQIKGEGERLVVRAKLGVVLAIEELEEKGFRTTHRFLSTEGARSRLKAKARELVGDQDDFARPKLAVRSRLWSFQRVELCQIGSLRIATSTAMKLC
jgi:hypothetical protein